MKKTLFLLPIMAMLLAGCTGAEDPHTPTGGSTGTPSTGDTSTGDTSTGGGSTTSSGDTSTGGESTTGDTSTGGSSTDTGSATTTSTTEESDTMTLTVTGVPFDTYMAGAWAFHMWNSAEEFFPDPIVGQRDGTSLTAEVSKKVTEFLVVAYNGNALYPGWVNKVAQSQNMTVVAGQTSYAYVAVETRAISITNVPANAEVEHWAIHSWGEGFADTYDAKFVDGTVTGYLKPTATEFKVVGYAGTGFGDEWVNVKYQSDAIALTEAETYDVNAGGGDTPVVGADYYIVGSFCQWQFNATELANYKFVEHNKDMPEGTKAQYRLLEVSLEANTEFKVYNPTTTDKFINGSILEDGSQYVQKVPSNPQTPDSGDYNVKALKTATYTLYLKVQNDDSLKLYVGCSYTPSEDDYVTINITLGKWAEADAVVFAWVWGNGFNSYWEQVKDGKLKVLNTVTGFKLVRMPAGSTAADWDNNWGTTGDITYEAGKTLVFTDWNEYGWVD